MALSPATVRPATVRPDNGTEICNGIEVGDGAKAGDGAEASMSLRLAAVPVRTHPSELLPLPVGRGGRQEE